MSEPVNLHDVAVGDFAVARGSDNPPGYRVRSARLGPGLGASRLGGTVYELDPGDSICPYHYEGVEEEWLLVLAGMPTLRDPDGEHELVAGDVVCFAAGPGGAHKVTNRADVVARVLMLSNIPRGGTSICVYPDSDKVGIWPPGTTVRLGDPVSYWDGEV